MVSSLCFGFDCFHDKGQGSGEEGPSHQTTLQTGIHSRYRNWFKKGVQNYIDLIPSSLGQGVGYVGKNCSQVFRSQGQTKESIISMSELFILRCGANFRTRSCDGFFCFISSSSYKQMARVCSWWQGSNTKEDIKYVFLPECFSFGNEFRAKYRRPLPFSSPTYPDSERRLPTSTRVG